MKAAVLLLAGYALLAYVVLPLGWREHEGAGHPAWREVPAVAVNGQGIPGDPLNVGLIGNGEDLKAAMLEIGWREADPLSLGSSLKIAESVLLDRPDPQAPVSRLYVFGRKQDLAFEREAGASAAERHHVRWWRSAVPDEAGRTLWVGSVTFDKGAGVSHLTGEITHHIGADVDAERDALMAALGAQGRTGPPWSKAGCGATREGRNAGGDAYATDGMMSVGVLRTTAPGRGPKESSP